MTRDEAVRIVMDALDQRRHEWIDEDPEEGTTVLVDEAARIAVEALGFDGSPDA
jgi:hypothetical protein